MALDDGWWTVMDVGNGRQMERELALPDEAEKRKEMSETSSSHQLPALLWVWVSSTVISFAPSSSAFCLSAAHLRSDTRSEWAERTRPLIRFNQIASYRCPPVTFSDCQRRPSRRKSKENPCLSPCLSGLLLCRSNLFIQRLGLPSRNSYENRPTVSILFESQREKEKEEREMMPIANKLTGERKKRALFSKIMCPTSLRYRCSFISARVKPCVLPIKKKSFQPETRKKKENKRLKRNLKKDPKSRELMCH